MSSCRRWGAGRQKRCQQGGPVSNEKKFAMKVDSIIPELTWNKILDAGGLAVGEEVAIQIDAELMKESGERE